MFQLHWVEIHAGINHLPFAFLLVIPIFEIGAIFFHKKEWHVVSFWLLVASVIALIPTAITGWITGNDLQFFGKGSYPPELLSWHWMLAVITAILATVWLIWRIAAHDEIRGKWQLASFFLSVVIAAIVGTVGWMGGRMVLGDSNPTEKETLVPLQNASPETQAQMANIDADLVERGAKLFTELPCQSCHTMNGVGGKTGPDLTHEAQRHSDLEWHVVHLKDPSVLKPDPGMPPFDDLPEDQLKALAAYLSTRE